MYLNGVKAVKSKVKK